MDISTSGLERLGMAKLVMYGLIEFLCHRSGWTSSVDEFLGWLNLLSFGGGFFGESALAVALATALRVLLLPSSCMVVHSGSILELLACWD